jgi:transmembrane sensor
MRHVQTPLRQHLRESHDERALQRIWRGVERRRAGMIARARARWIAGGGLVLAAAFLLVERSSGPIEPGPLHQLAGGEPTVLEAPVAAQELSVPFDDGSRLTLSPAAHVTVVENSGHTFVIVLSSGRATFDVHPGGPRRWSIECGLATVEVVGTRFTINRTPKSVEISVDRGTVLVRGERVPERLQRLLAGQSLRLGETSPDRGAEIGAARLHAAPSPPPPAPSPPPPETTATPPAREPATEAWRELVRGGRYRRAYGALGRRGIARTAQAATPQELLWLADVARLSGHPAAAVLPLRRLIERYPRDRNAPIALFTLGRIELDSLGDNQAAADAFSSAIAAGVPRSLSEDAAARLVEARARAGDLAGARTAADRYLSEFPNGRHAADVRRWTTPP